MSLHTVLQKEPLQKRFSWHLSGLVAGSFAICGLFGGPGSAIAACGLRFVRNGPNTVWGSTVSDTELSEFFGAH